MDLFGAKCLSGVCVLQGCVVLITGGAGFIGSSLAKELVEKNKVILFDNFSRNALQYTNLQGHPNITVIAGDVTKQSELILAISQSVDIIIHCAAIAGITTVQNNTVKTIQTDLFGLYNICEICRVYKYNPLIVNFSTSQIFGKIAVKNESDDPAVIQCCKFPRWSYAASKFLSQHMLFAYRRQYGLRGINIRPYNVYGYGQVGQSALTTFIKAALTNNDIIINGNGLQIRDWCYITDFVSILLRIISDPESQGKSFNIGNGNNALTINQIAQIVRTITSSTSIIRVLGNSNQQDVSTRICDMREIQSKYGITPRVSIIQGLTNTVQFTKKYLI